MNDLDLLSIDDAAKFLEISKPTLYRLIADDAIVGVKVGRRWRFRQADLAAYLKRSPASVHAAPEELLDVELAFFTELLAAAGKALPELAESVATVDESRDASDISERKTMQLAAAILMYAISHGASDLHFEPCHESNDIKLRVRMRIDGALADIRVLPGPMREPLGARIKVMAGMSVAEQRVPQDGRIPLKTRDGEEFDVRVSSVPALYGESLVLRILSRAAVWELDKMGLSPGDRTRLDGLLARHSGLMLCTGPTGSGKTTLLYSLVTELNQPSRKLMSVEDPVEYALPGITQIPVNVRAGVTFSSAFRAILRQDPDVILAGELRDAEMAQMALEAALTGHLILSTLHTNDTVDALKRFRDLDIPAFYVTGALAGVTAQRLCRRLCPHCRVAVDKPLDNPTNRKILDAATAGGWHGPDEPMFYQAVGCNECRGGYRRRIAVYEVLVMTEKLCAAYAGGESIDDLRAIAISGGMKTLVADAVQKASEGLTTLQAVAAACDF